MLEFSCNATTCSGSAGKRSCLLVPIEYHRNVLPWIYVCVAVLGFLTNVAAMLQLCRLEKTATVIFTLNIMVSDLIVCCSFAIRTAYYRKSLHWHAGSGPCVAAEFFMVSGFYINLYCNMGFFLWISISRYTTVVRPTSRLFRAFRRPRFFWAVCLVTWILGIALVCSSVGYKAKLSSAVKETVSCFDQVANFRKQELDGVHAVGVVVFFCVLAAMLLSYGLLIFHLQRVRKRSLVGAGLGPGGGLRVRRKILASMLLFIACFLPYHVQMVRVMSGPRDCEEEQAGFGAKTLTVLVAAFNSCLHPALHLFFHLPCCRAQRNVRAPPRPEGSQIHAISHMHTGNGSQNAK